jgi:hypothetical protein
LKQNSADFAVAIFLHGLAMRHAYFVGSDFAVCDVQMVG